MIRGLTILLLTIGLAAIKGNAQQLTMPRLDLSKPVGLPTTPSIKLPGSEAVTCDWGFFCKQEAKADKKLPMPVRLRLGNMQMTDFLENKNRDLLSNTK